MLLGDYQPILKALDKFKIKLFSVTNTLAYSTLELVTALNVYALASTFLSRVCQLLMFMAEQDNTNKRTSLAHHRVSGFDKMLAF
jgi:hypothetical protein